MGVWAGSLWEETRDIHTCFLGVHDAWGIIRGCTEDVYTVRHDEIWHT